MSAIERTFRNRNDASNRSKKNRFISPNVFSRKIGVLAFIFGGIGNHRWSNCGANNFHL